MKLILENIISLLHFKLILYCTLFTVTVFTNKYILSTLKFTYPTVFQGWQTLMASLFLLIMKGYSSDNMIYTPRSYGLCNLLPNMIFHVCSIVAGSKALSTVPIAVFLSVSNITNVAVHISLKSSLSKLQLISGTITLITSIILLFSRDANISDISNVWLITYIFFITVDALYSDFVNIKISRMKKLWYTNCFSVMVLAPASLYLQEAFSALEFAMTNKLIFFVSVTISGICGGMTHVLSTNIDYNYSQAIAVILAAITSQFVFTNDSLTGIYFQVLLVNLISNIVLCAVGKTVDKTPIELTVI